MPREWWFTTEPYLRFKTWSIDPANPFSPEVALPCWIWVDEITLSAVIDRLCRERNGWGPVETYEEWDARQAAPVESTGAGRPQKTLDILRQFRDRVASDQVLKRATWEGEAISSTWSGEQDAPTAKTCADRIRPYFNAITRNQLGTIANQQAILDMLDDALNGF